ncbi:MAG: glycosyltransferase family 2 protein [Smithella sp.]|jgi:glycosyltransferase involved in cell wall biosynthesis|nr:glycosyltransferase family 2 protein [Smithella sp.]
MTRINSDLPLISVIMPVYNRDMYLHEAIESILCQTYQNFELIIADDGSTDGSVAIIREYAGRDRRIRPLFFAHRGIPRTSNTAVVHAGGEFIARQDSDDIALPNRLEDQYRWFMEKNIDICGCRFAFFKGKEDEKSEELRWQPESHENIVMGMLLGHPLLTGTMMAKASVFVENPFDETTDFIDTAWPMQMALKYKTSNVPKFLLKVRRHEKNITTLRRGSFKNNVSKARFSFFYHLFPGTQLHDYLAYIRMADKAAMTSLKELERAGHWLVQFTAKADEELLTKLRRLWETVCDRSGHLGNEVKEIFNRFDEKIGRYHGLNLIEKKNRDDV